MLKFIPVIILILTISGCASMSSPSPSLIETVPVVKIGTTANTPEDHIVFIPANKRFPIEFSVGGNVFIEGVSSKVMASFKQDMYLYKYWASLDGKKWVNSHKLMKVEPSGGFDKSGAIVGVQLNIIE